MVVGGAWGRVGSRVLLGMEIIAREDSSFSPPFFFLKFRVCLSFYTQRSFWMEPSIGTEAANL